MTLAGWHERPVLRLVSGFLLDGGHHGLTWTEHPRASLRTPQGFGAVGSSTDHHEPRVALWR